MATIERDGYSLAVELGALAEQGPTVLDLGPDRVIVAPVDGGARFYLGSATDLDGAVAGENELSLGGEAYPRLLSGKSFWFAWFGLFPDTTWWPETGS